MRPVWKELYSIASSTYTRYLWCDLSLLFNCPQGIDNVATAINNDGDIWCMFHWHDSNKKDAYDSNFAKYGVTIKADDEQRIWWNDCVFNHVAHYQQYTKWKKIA